MNYIRTTDPNISYYLLPWYLPWEMDKIEMGEELYRRLTEEPQNTYLEIAVDGSDVKGFVCAFIRDDTAFIWQANARPEVDVKDRLSKIEDWAREKGLRAITAEADRPRALSRKYGFRQENNLIIKEV